ncbi:MAG: MMPL family transporter [Actinomycetota bacterium]|nr:MMPL family transporter [Actinomycetota bacterium]
MALRISPETLARASSRHPWRTVIAWVVVLVVAGGLTSSLLADVLSNDIAFTNNPESVQAQDLMESKVTGKQPNTQLFIVRSDSHTVQDPEFQQEVTRVQQAITALGKDVVAGPVATYYQLQNTPQGKGLVSTDQHATLIPVNVRNEEISTADALRSVIGKSTAPGFQVLVAGNAVLNADNAKISEEDIKKGESFGIIAALIVLIIVFGAVVAAILPIVMAIFAIVIALGLVSLIGQLVHFQLFVTNMVTMIGLAVGIDYSLFIVSRYREERRRGFEKLEAIGATGATASRAVFFSGVTVVLALIGMLILPTTIFRALAGGAILVVIASLAASMTLLPALLGLLGDKVNALRVFGRKRAPGAEPVGGFWDRVTKAVMHRPVVSLVAGAIFMLAAGSFYLGIHTGFAGVSTLPDAVQSKQAFIVLQKEFAGGQTSPAQIVVQGDIASPQIQTAISKLQQAIANEPAFSGQTSIQANSSKTVAVVSALFSGDPSSDASVAAIRTLRSQIVPQAFSGTSAKVLVGGDTAFATDFFDLAGHYQPIVFAFVLGLSFLLLTVVFRSIVVPIKAIIMNLLSVFAAYGLITLVFQKGGPAFGKWIADLLHFQQVESVEAWIPLFLFSVLFGLSMDYHVFLLTRIREHFDKTHDNTEAVAYGLRTTAGIITGAALIMVAVFAGFAAGRIIALKQMGFGLAVAVFFDATIVRSVLVPASMKLLGDRNWYLPSWLQWLPRLNVEGAEPVRIPDTAPPPVPVAADE